MISVSPFTGRPLPANSSIARAKLEAAQKLQAVPANSEPLAYIQDVSPSLARYLRPQSAFQWWTLPYLSAMTPQYIQNLLISALAGNHVPTWQMFDMMIDTSPELAACIGEYVDGILEKNLLIEAYHEEDEKPSANAIRNKQIVSAAFQNMRPDPAADENAIDGTIRDILFARFHGQSILEADWFDTFGNGAVNRIDVNGVGTILAPRSTFWVHPICYAFDTTGRLGLRIPPDAIKGATKDAKGWKPGALPTDYGLGNALSYYGYTGSPRPASLMEFPPNQFLISIFKFKTGSALAASCLRPLAWWWCVANFAGDWLLDLAQIFGIPFRKATYKQGTGEPQKAEAREMLQNMGSRGWCLLDERVTVEFEKAMESGAQSPQGFLVELAERQMRKVILRQTMTGNHGTMGKGGGQAFGQTEQDVKGKCLNAGAKFACQVLRDQLARQIVRVNTGDDSELPLISLSDDDQGTLEDAQSIQALSGAGAGKAIPLSWVNRRFNIPPPSEGEETLADAKPAAPPASPTSNGQSPKPGGPGATPEGADSTAKNTKNAEEEKSAEAAQLEASRHSSPATRHALGAPAPAYQSKALEQYAAAFAEDVHPVLDRLGKILEIKDDALFVKKLEAFHQEFPQLKKDVLADPAAARALQPIIATALANGLARESKVQSPKTDYDQNIQPPTFRNRQD